MAPLFLILLRFLPLHAQATFAPDEKSKLLLTAGNDKVGRLWSLETGRVKQKLVGHTKKIYAADFSPCDPICVSPPPPLPKELVCLFDRAEAPRSILLFLPPLDNGLARYDAPHMGCGEGYERQRHPLQLLL